MRLTWDRDEIETGLYQGVFYSGETGLGEAWTGLTSIDENEDGSEQTRFVDGLKQAYNRKAGYFSGTIEAVSYPPSFYVDILSQRCAKPFGLSYRVGNKLHLVYGVSVLPAKVTYRAGYDNPTRWDFSTLPFPLRGFARTAHIVIKTSEPYPGVIAALEDILYGTDTTDPRLPTPDEIVDFFESHATLQIIDHGDGTWTAIGPDDVVTMLDSTTFQISWPSAVYIDAVSYTVSTL